MGRGRSFGGRTHGHHGTHHHHYGRGSGGSIGGIGFEDSVDGLANSNIGPTLLNGNYSLTGSQMSVLTHLDNFDAFAQQNLQMNMPPVNQASLIIVGNKTSSTNYCCYGATILTGAFCILPFLFTCCMWWKKIVMPRYEVNLEVYHSVGRLISRAGSTITNLTLEVVDNAFNAEKANILVEAISKSKLTGFTFKNQALGCNYNQNEFDDFSQNMMPLKSLAQVTSSCIWDDTIV